MKNKTMRKPDFENESFRMWETSKKEKDEYKDTGSKIKVLGQEIALIGFTEVSKKDDDKLIFAYKFKHNNKTILFVIPDDLLMEEKKVIEFLGLLNTMAESIGYKVMDMRDSIKSIKNEKHIIDKMKKEKD